MSTATFPTVGPGLIQLARDGKSVLLGGISWEEYTELGGEIGEQPVRLTFDRGNLEIMTTSREHEIYKCLLSMFVVTLADEMNLPLAVGGSMTFRREDLDRGLEPDSCYWIANESRVRGRLELDFTSDPPPDLVIEVEISRTILDRIGIYAALGVPEIWRFNGTAMEVGLLQLDSTYLWGKSSMSFNGLSIHDIAVLLKKARTEDHLTAHRALRTWLRGKLTSP